MYLEEIMNEKTNKKVNQYTVTMVLFLIVIFGCLINISQVVPDWYDNLKKSVKKEIKQKDATFVDALRTGIAVTEGTTNENLLAKDSLVDFFGLFNRAIGKKYIPEQNALRSVYKMDNDQLTFVYPKHGVKTAVENMQALQEVCKERNSQLLYVQWPNKVNQYNNQLPHGIPDQINPTADKFLDRLDDSQIDYLDYRDVLPKSNKEYTSKFYDTDHHWTTTTAFEAYTYLSDFLKTNYAFDYDKKNTDLNNFHVVNLPDSFIGALGNQVGKWYGGVDDFEYIYPKFDTDFQWRKISINKKPDVVRSGLFEESVLFTEPLENPQVPMAYRDNCYFNGNPALARITNNKTNNDKKILFVVDSYSKPVASFMSLNAKQVDFMDLRDFDKQPLVEYISKKDYDYVVVAYTLNVFKGQSYKQGFTFTE